MAVAQKSDGDSKRTVEEGAKPSCRERTDADPCELIQLRKSDGLSTGPRDIKRDAFRIVNSYNPRRNRNKGSKSGNHFDIDDAEVSGYLNTKEEIHLKRILWEAMNVKCTKAKKQKRATETKKAVTVKKAAQTTEKPKFESRSSRINYDALELLNDELN